MPYLPEAKKKQAENQANWLDRDPEIKCYLPGVPRANYMPFPFQILHSDKAMFFAYEYAGAVRNIYLKDPGPAPVDSWMGQSVGTWDGDTFVVTVTGFNDQSWFDRAGNHHSDQLKVVERYTPQGPDHLWYEATIEDPQTFSRPWKIRMPLYRHINPNARLNQFKCVEFVEELMYGQIPEDTRYHAMTKRHRASCSPRSLRRRSSRSKKPGRAAHAGWQARSPGHLEQCDDHAARAAAERHQPGAERRGSDADGTRHGGTA